MSTESCSVCSTTGKLPTRNWNIWTSTNLPKKFKIVWYFKRKCLFKIGTASIENALLKYGAKDHFFRAGLCHLCIDHLNCQQAIARYESILAAFADSREANFLKQLAQSVDENNVENFTNTVKDYDSMSRLDNWCTTLLLRVKKTMNEEPDLK